MKPVSQASARINASHDVIGHPSVQPWSAGDYFPAVIYRRDVHADVRSLDGSYPLRHSSWCVMLDGVTRCGYASHDDAEEVARGLIADPVARSAWQCGDDCED